MIDKTPLPLLQIVFLKTFRVVLKAFCVYKNTTDTVQHLNTEYAMDCDLVGILCLFSRKQATFKNEKILLTSKMV